MVELPVEWIKDDYPYFGMDRVTAIRPHTAPSLVGEIWRREFDGAYAERGLFLLTMHPHIIGHRSRVSVLDELIRHMARTAACGSPRTRTSRDTSRRKRGRGQLPTLILVKFNDRGERIFSAGQCFGYGVPFRDQFGNMGEVTVYPPSGWGDRIRGIL